MEGKKEELTYGRKKVYIKYYFQSTGDWITQFEVNQGPSKDKEDADKEFCMLKEIIENANKWVILENAIKIIKKVNS